MRQIFSFNWNQYLGQMREKILIKILVPYVVLPMALVYVITFFPEYISISGCIIFAGLVTLFVLVKNKATFVVLLFALAPFTGLIKVFLNFKEAPLVLDFLFLTVITHAILQKVLSGRHLKIKVPKIGWLMIIFLIIAFFEIFNPNQPNLMRGIYGFRASGTFYMLSFFVALLVIKSKEDILRIMKVFMIAGFIVALYGIYQFLNPSSPEISYITKGEAWTGWTHFAKPFSTMIGPFHFGVFMVFASLFVLTFLWAKKEIKANNFSLKLVLVFTLIAILISLTRASYLAFAIGVIFLMFHKRKKIKFIVTLTTLIIVMITVFRIIPQSQVVLFRISTLTHRVDTSLQSRFSAWPGKVKLIVDNPFGFGIGMTGGAANLLGRTDNQFLTIGVETGWAGLFIFVWIILDIIKKEVKLLKLSKEPFLQTSGLWITAVTMGLFSVMMTNQILEAYPINMYFWFLIGMLYKLKFIDLM